MVWISGNSTAHEMGEILLAPMNIDDIDESFYNIVIEIDENIASYLKTLSPGCLLSVSELLSLATKLSCDTCSATFYSQTLLQGHLDTHHHDDDSGSVEEEIDTELSVECTENELVDVKVEVEEEDQGDSIKKSETHRNPSSSCPSKDSTPLRILDKSKSKYEDTESKALFTQTGIGTELQENKIKRCYVKILKISNKSFEGFDDLVSSLSNSNISEKSSRNKRKAKQVVDLDHNNDMSEYEKIREENIKARENMLAALMVDFQNYKKDFGIRQYIQSEETRRRKRQRKRDLKYHSIRSRPKVSEKEQLERREKSSRIADQSIWAYTHPEDSSEIEEVWNEERRGKYCQRLAGEAGNEEEDAIVITDDEDEEGAGAEGAERALVTMLRGALDPGDTGLVSAAELSSFLRVTSPDQQRVVNTCRGEGGMVDYRRLVRQLLHK